MSTIAIAGLCVLFGATGPRPEPYYVPVPPGLVDREALAQRLDTYRSWLHDLRTEREYYEQLKNGVDYAERVRLLKRQEAWVQRMIESGSRALEPRPWMPVMPPAQLPGSRPRPKVWD